MTLPHDHVSLPNAGAALSTGGGAAPRAARRTFLLALGIFILTMALLLVRVLAATGGTFLYALDDAYIHMTMARNWAAGAGWGVNPGIFSSSTSSPLWTLLLGLVDRLAGAGVWTPLLLNSLFAVALIGWFQAMLARRIAHAGLNLLALLLLIFFIPLPALAFTGLEHIFHILLALPFVNLAAGILAEGNCTPKRPAGHWRIVLLLGLAGLLPVTRYESFFLIAMLGLLLLVRRRWRLATALGLAAAAPVACYGFWSVHHGWHWLPNSVLLKGNPPDFGSLAGALTTLLTIWRMWYDNPYMIFLCLACVVTFYIRLRRDGHPWSQTALLNLITAGAIVLHMALARSGWFFRYEAYLIALGAYALLQAWHGAAVSVIMSRFGRGRRLELAALLGVMLLALLPFLPRLFSSLAGLPHAVLNTHDQQYQMARFCAAYRPGEAVAVNDIGAVGYYGNVKVIDLFGLANDTIAREKLADNYTSRLIERVCAASGVRVAMVYDRWYRDAGGLPPAWIKVAEWEVDDNRILGDATVAIYSTSPDPAEAARLRDQLRAFAPTMPATVKVRL